MLWSVLTVLSSFPGGEDLQKWEIFAFKERKQEVSFLPAGGGKQCVGLWNKNGKQKETKYPLSEYDNICEPNCTKFYHLAWIWEKGSAPEGGQAMAQLPRTVGRT